MTAEYEIRDFDAVRDAARVADFYNRYADELPRRGGPLDADALQRVLRERCVDVFLVADTGDAIVGTIGYSRNSSRRVAGPRDTFAGLFLIETLYRSTRLAGELFIDSFDRLVDQGIRTIRVEVVPSNTQAFPIYLKLGCRAAAEVPPDENGYIELVNHLPGAVDDVRSRFGIPGTTSQSEKRGWIRGAGRKPDAITSGVVWSDGVPTFTHTMRLGDRTFDVTVDLHSGRTLSIDDGDGAVELASFGHGLTETTEVAPANPSITFGSFTAEVRATGDIVITHPDVVGAVLCDPFPIVEGVDAFGARRPIASAAQIVSSAGTIRATRGEGAGRLTRVIRPMGDALAVTVAPHEDTHPCGHVIVSLWNSLRISELYRRSSSDDRWLGGPVASGLWPTEAMDFEANQIPEHVLEAVGAETRIIDADRGLGLGLRFVSDGELRFEGGYQPLYRSETRLAEYRLEPVVAPSRDEVDTVSTIVTHSDADASRTPIVSAADRAEAAHEEDSLAALGLAATDSRRAKFGPFLRRPTSMWAWTQGDRRVLDVGVGWYGAPNSAAPELSLREDTPGIILVTADAAPSDKTELAIGFAPELDGERPVRLADSSGRFWSPVETGAVWKSSSRAVALPLRTGGYLFVQGAGGEAQEVFIRMRPDGVMVTLLTAMTAGEPGHAEWHVERCSFDRSIEERRGTNHEFA